MRGCSIRFLPSLAYQGGTCCNRFYDKLQLIVCEDGSAGINFEHSAVDGHTVLRFVSDVFAQTVVAFAKSVTKSIYRGDCPIPNIVNAKVERTSDTNGGGNYLTKHILRPAQINSPLISMKISKASL